MFAVLVTGWKESKIKSLEDRFWSKVNKTDDCWLWTASTYKSGYGHFRRKINDKWTMYKSHRFSYELANRCEIPKNLFVLHKCDVPACVNPDHLYLGTHADNMRDMREKGRNRWGNNPNHRLLSYEIAKNIRKDYRNGLRYKQIEEKYSVSKQQVSRIVLNLIWKRKAGT